MGHELIPLSLFFCVTYAFTYLVKALLDARTRALLAQTSTNEDLLRALLASDERQRRLAALRWGIALVGVSVGFALIQVIGWNDLTPGAIAVLAGAVGLGQLVFVFISSKLGNGKTTPAPPS